MKSRRYLSSLPLDAQTFARAGRGHWGVENKLHWTLDVRFPEDQSRARSGLAAENLATLRRLALNLFKREKTKSEALKTNNSMPLEIIPICCAFWKFRCVCPDCRSYLFSECGPVSRSIP